MATDRNCDHFSEELARQLEDKMAAQFGPLLSGERLSQALGYPTLSSFRQALSRKTVPIPVFTIPNRRGKFALVKDVAQWLASQRNAVITKTPTKSTV